jgi:hypothetical protein
MGVDARYRCGVPDCQRPEGHDDACGPVTTDDLRKMGLPASHREHMARLDEQPAPLSAEQLVAACMDPPSAPGPHTSVTYSINGVPIDPGQGTKQDTRKEDMGEAAGHYESGWKAGHADALRAAEQREVQLREALVEARDAIATLSVDALGSGFIPVSAPNGECAQMEYPLRDELLDRLSKVIDAARKDAGDE